MRIVDGRKDNYTKGFGALEIGDTFKHKGALLMKTHTTVLEATAGAKSNAIRLDTASREWFEDDRQVCPRDCEIRYVRDRPDDCS